MKSFKLLIAGLLLSTSGWSQTDIPAFSIQCSEFSISKPLREISAASGKVKHSDDNEREGLNKRIPFVGNNPNALPKGDDPALQRNAGTRNMSDPLVNFLGVTSNSYPPDPSGAAGPNHYVQAINTSYRVFSKTGTPLTNKLNLSSLWPGSSDDGDPIVLYDKHADRWFISQFQVTGNKILIAISTTPDPTDSYYLYTFVPVANSFPDYPKFSIWGDAYYMTSNYGSQRVVAFEREKMLLGDATAKMIVKPISGLPSAGFVCPLAADADGQLPPFGDEEYIFSLEDDNWGGTATADRIRIYKMKLDWATPANSTFSLHQSLFVEPFNTEFSGTWDDISQKGSTTKLDAIAGVFNYRAQYRIWTGYNSVTLCHAVNVDGNGWCGIRWYELRQDQTTKDWEVYQQGTYAPDLQNRWLGSIAMDDNGSIGIAYAVAGDTTYPSLYYTGRLASDPLNEFTYVEKCAIKGASAQSGVNRFGDYSHTSVDPDGLTFWHTGEYFASSQRTRVFSWQIVPDNFGLKESSKSSGIKVYQDAGHIFVDASLEEAAEYSVDLFDAMGKRLESSKINGKAFNTFFKADALPKGTYLVRVGNPKFQRVEKVLVK